MQLIIKEAFTKPDGTDTIMVSPLGVSPCFTLKTTFKNPSLQFLIINFNF